MLRTMEEREPPNPKSGDEEFLTLGEIARLMHVSAQTARRMFRFEPGVNVSPPTGSKRPLIRVPRAVYDRVMRRSANPYQS